MKKLKIFLLLSILLCFGFILSSEVHAQGDGPKIFEVGDVLPATTQLKIYAEISNYDSYIATTDGYLFFDFNWDEESDTYGLFSLYVGGVLIDQNEYYDYFYDDFIIDTSEWTISQRTITHVVYDLTSDDYITWEDLNVPQGFNITFEENGGTSVTDLSGQTTLPNPLPTPTKENHSFLGWYYDSDFTNEAFADDPLTDDVTLYAKWEQVTSNAKVFEVGDVLPRTTQLRISWSTITSSDFTQTAHKWIRTYDNEYFIYIQYEFFNSQEFRRFHINYNVIYNPYGWVHPYTDKNGSHAYIDLDTSLWTIEQRTIVQVDTDTVLNALTWEDLNPLSLDYTDGYADGFADAEVTYELGYERARDEYAYYDPITNQWLSVEEYLGLYGTDKPGQSDFYANFDKYFIPALIIVFVGTIVLTILKVFKGRE